MLISCPSCGLENERLNDATDNTIICKACSATFSAKSDSVSEEALSERVWKVKGENGLPVSLRVLRFRVSKGNLGLEKELSRDGKTWLRVDAHPALRDSFPVAEDLKLKEPHNNNVSEASLDSHMDDQKALSPTSADKNEGRVLLSRPRGWLPVLGFASFILITSGSFFFPLSKDVESLALNNKRLLTENIDLKEMLSASDQKMTQLEERIAKLDDELENVKALNEDFRHAKSILEDIKKSIDSNKIYLAVSLEENRLFVKIGTKTIKEYTVSTGKGKTRLKGSGKIHNFLTPRGRMVINAKERNPVWYKPNWAWEEAGLDLPESISIEDRAVKGELGKYRLKLKDGYAIHGTKRGVVEGGKVTHGCIRIGREDLKKLYSMVKKGTEVYIY
ncbi:MAG: L,D-transpeptidase family protein [bacterium]|nr:L,D-transpeptidase family protein [bacterium]